MADIRFRPASELPENPPDGMRIAAMTDRSVKAFAYLVTLKYSERFQVYSDLNRGIVVDRNQIKAWLPESELLQAAEEVE